MPSDLPIVTPDPPQPSRGAAEKYGGLYYLGIAGLLVLVALVAWFGMGLWSMRGVFAHIYTLHNSRRSDADRIAAAYALSRDPNFTPQQAWDIALRKDLPPLARYLVAESLTPAIVADDPRAYTLRVARSQGWPDWLRVLALRPIAYAADDHDLRFPDEALNDLPLDDYAVGLWSSYVQALRSRESGIMGHPNRRLALAASSDSPHAELARLLLAALQASGPRRDAWLDQATQWLRHGDPACRAVWDGWTIHEGRIIRDPAHQLHAGSTNGIHPEESLP